MAKRSFLLNDDWGTLFLSLPDDKAGQLIKAAFRHHAGESVVIDDPVLGAVFAMLREMIDQNEAKYAERCRQNKENIERRWNTVEQNQVQNDTVVDARTETNTKNTDNDNDYDNDLKEKGSATQSRKRNPKKVEEQKHKFGDYGNVLLTDSEREKLIRDFGSEETADAIAFLDSYIKEKGYKSKSHYLTMRRWVFNAASDRKRSSRDKPKKIAERKYDFDDIERMFVGRS